MSLAHHSVLFADEIAAFPGIMEQIDPMTAVARR